MCASLRARVQRLEQRLPAETAPAVAAQWAPSPDEAGAIFDVLADVLQDEGDLAALLLGQAEALRLDGAAAHLREFADSRARISSTAGEGERPSPAVTPGERGQDEQQGPVA